MEPILDPAYWKERLDTAAQLHHAIMKCPLEKWQRIEAKHREILKRVVQPDDRVLDAGAGYGRLLTLMPDHWRGPYHGVDLSPDFIAKAKADYPERDFRVGSIMDRIDVPPCDLAVLISIRPMIVRNLSQEAWEMAEVNLQLVAKRLLFLEYDETSEGEIS